MSRLGPLARREFRLLFLARATSFFGSSVAPVALAAGPTAEAIGIDETLYLAAAIVTLAVVAIVATPDVRRLRRREPVDDPWRTFDGAWHRKADRDRIRSGERRDSWGGIVTRQR